MSNDKYSISGKEEKDTFSKESSSIYESDIKSFTKEDSFNSPPLQSAKDNFYNEKTCKCISMVIGIIFLIIIIVFIIQSAFELYF